MTPVEVEVLMFYHFMIIDHSRINTPAIKDAINMWVANGILKPDSKTTTEKGTALVEMICSTPMPIPSWKDPR